MLTDLSILCVSPDCSIRQAVSCIDRNEKGIVLVTDAVHRLLGTITDGDVRRAMLAGESLDTPVRVLLDRKSGSAYSKPVTAPLGTPHDELLRLMHDRALRQIPLLDAQGCVATLVTLDELLPDKVVPLTAVVMAGGYGARLAPLTESTPKPMLRVGDRPLLEHIIDQLRETGIQQVNISTHYKSEQIKEHFGDGHDFGVKLNYVTEDQPLGTAGALGLMDTPQQPLLVINGDILTRVDYRAMLTYHREHNADLTVAVRKYDLNVPYGVIRAEGSFVKAVEEKPSLSFFVNAGIYLLEPSVHGRITSGEHLDMTDLIERLLAAGRPVVSFPVREYWLDIGQLADYEKAQDDLKNGRLT